MNPCERLIYVQWAANRDVGPLPRQCWPTRTTDWTTEKRVPHINGSFREMSISADSHDASLPSQPLLSEPRATRSSLLHSHIPQAHDCSSAHLACSAATRTAAAMAQVLAHSTVRPVVAAPSRATLQRPAARCGLQSTPLHAIVHDPAAAGAARVLGWWVGDLSDLQS